MVTEDEIFVNDQLALVQKKTVHFELDFDVHYKLLTGAKKYALTIRDVMIHLAEKSCEDPQEFDRELLAAYKRKLKRRTNYINSQNYKNEVKISKINKDALYDFMEKDDNK